MLPWSDTLQSNVYWPTFFATLITTGALAVRLYLMSMARLDIFIEEILYFTGFSVKDINLISHFSKYFIIINLN